MHFTNDQWNWASLPMFISHLYVLYCEMSFNFFRPFSSWVVWLSFSYQFVVVLYIFSYGSPPLSVVYTRSRIDSLICFEIRIHWIFSPMLPQLTYWKVYCFPSNLSATTFTYEMSIFIRSFHVYLLKTNFVPETICGSVSGLYVLLTWSVLLTQMLVPVFLVSLDIL